MLPQLRHTYARTHTEKVVLCSSCIGRWLKDVSATVVVVVEINLCNGKRKGGDSSDSGKRRRVSEVRVEGQN